MRLTRAGAWLLLATALVILVAWPPDKDRSLLVKAVNWSVDPTNTLPILPPQLGFGLSDDVEAVEMRDAMVRRYDVLFNRDAFTRLRLELKTAEDPFNAASERQLLLMVGAIVAFVVVRRGLAS
jgi:hypothetical protein